MKKYKKDKLVTKFSFIEYIRPADLTEDFPRKPSLSLNLKTNEVKYIRNKKITFLPNVIYEVSPDFIEGLEDTEVIYRCLKTLNKSYNEKFNS